MASVSPSVCAISVCFFVVDCVRDLYLRVYASLPVRLCLCVSACASLPVRLCLYPSACASLPVRLCLCVCDRCARDESVWRRRREGRERLVATPRCLSIGQALIAD
jgi:hypothetical protein